MEEDTTLAASFLLYQRVKVAIAILLLKVIPEGKNVQEFVRNFQYKFRDKAKHCNLLLEKQLFQRQFILLLPELNVYSIESQRSGTRLSEVEPMEIDDEGSEHVVFLSSNDSKLIYSDTTPSALEIAEPQTILLKKIKSLSKFLSAVLKTKILCCGEQNVASSDIIKILRRLEISDSEGCSKLVSYDNYKCSRKFVSITLMRYLMKSVNIDRLITQASLKLIWLFEKCQNFRLSADDGQNEIIFKILKAILAANNIIFACFTILPRNADDERTVGRAIVSFLRRSLNELLVTGNSTLDRKICCTWYTLFGRWKKVDYICQEMIDTLIGIMKGIENDLYARTSPVQSTVTLEYSLAILKKLLGSYHQMYLARNHRKEDSNIDQWEQTLQGIIAESISQNSGKSIVRLAWHCVKIIISFKFPPKEKGL